MPDGKIDNGKDIAVGGVGVEGRRREHESNGGGAVTRFRRVDL